MPLIVHLDRFHRLHAPVAQDATDGVAQLQGDVEVKQTLHIVAGQSGEERHDLQHALHFGPFEGQAAGHDHTDVTGAQDDETIAGQVTLDVHEALGGARSVHARWPGARDTNLSAGALATTHGQHNGPRIQLCEARPLADSVDMAGRGDVQYHGVEQSFHSQLLDLADEPLGIRGSR